MKNKLWFQLTHVCAIPAFLILPSLLTGVFDQLFLICVFSLLVAAAGKSFFLIQWPVESRIYIPSVVWALLMWACIFVAGIFLPAVLSDANAEIARRLFGEALSFEFIQLSVFYVVGAFLVLIAWYVLSDKLSL